MVERAGVRRGPAVVPAAPKVAPVLLPQWLDRAARCWPALPAIEFMGKTISYREFAALVDHAAKGLQECGVGPGTNVGLLLPNSPHFPIAFFATLRAGGTAVSHWPHDDDDLFAQKIDESSTDVLVTLDLPELYGRASALLGRTRLRKLVVGNLAQFAAAPDTIGTQQALAGRRVPFPDDAQHLSFGRLLRNDGAFHAHAGLDPQHTIALLHYAGGAGAKRAMLTHADLANACERFATALTQPSAPPLAEGEESVLVLMPLFHVFSLAVNLLLAVRLGASMVLHAGVEDAHTMLCELQSRQVSVLAGWPETYEALVDALRTAHRDLGALKLCACGGQPLDAEVQRGFRALTGRRIDELWGQTGLSDLDEPLERGVAGWGPARAHAGRRAAAGG